MRGAWRPFPNQSNMKRRSALGTKQPHHTRNRFRPGQNLSACWLLQIALKRETGGTVYRVTGSYEEEGLLNGKLRRTLAQQMERASRHP